MFLIRFYKIFIEFLKLYKGDENDNFNDKTKCKKKKKL